MITNGRIRALALVATALVLGGTLWLSSQPCQALDIALARSGCVATLTPTGARSSSISHIQFSPDGQLITTSTSQGAIVIWHADGDPAPIELGTPMEAGAVASYWDIAFSPDGRLIAATQGQHAELWDIEAARMRWRVPTKGMTSIAFSPDGQQLALVGYRNSIQILRASDGSAASITPSPDHIMPASDFSPDGKYLATAGGQGVRLWSYSAESVQLQASSSHPWPSFDVAFAPDGSFLADANRHGITLWGAADLRELRTIGEQQAEADASSMGIDNIAISPDSALIASLTPGGTVALWRAADGRQLWERQERGIQDVAFSPDGKRLAVATLNSIQLWSIEAIQGN